MHQTRQQVSKRIPISRKGTKYVARAANDPSNAVPVVIAVRDMLKLARTAREVNEMIKQKLLKINGRVVYHPNESVKLFYLLEAGKTYSLQLLPTGKFGFIETKDTTHRLVKVIGKKKITGNKTQLHLHDGTNLISTDKINIGDSLYIDLSSKIKKHLPLEKGKSIFIIAGKYQGNTAKVETVEGKIVTITIDGGKKTVANRSVIVQ
ncbi:MAG TPA: hypothetical protein VJK51_01130 [Candidatus Nanoarchaeia archaeon]|nr:hypothetical protein [Candidatus Nanoarchaeia archaeon]